MRVVLDLNTITFMMDEQSTWIPTCEIWIILAGIVRKFYITSLEGKPGRMCGMSHIQPLTAYKKIHTLFLFVSRSKCECWS